MGENAKIYMWRLGFFIFLLHARAQFERINGGGCVDESSGYFSLWSVCFEVWY